MLYLLFYSVYKLQYKKHGKIRDNFRACVTDKIRIKKAKKGTPAVGSRIIGVVSLLIIKVLCTFFYIMYANLP